MLNDSYALAVLTALAQDTRLRIVRTLLTVLPEGLPAGRIATAVACSPSTLSFHLNQLEQAGLVSSRRQAQSVVYSAVPEALTGLSNYLLRDCCGGRPELCEASAQARDAHQDDRPLDADRGGKPSVV